MLQSYVLRSSPCHLLRIHVMYPERIYSVIIIMIIIIIIIIMIMIIIIIIIIITTATTTINTKQGQLETFLHRS